VFGLDFYTNLSSVVIDQETPFFIPFFLLQVTNTYKRYKHWFQEEDLLKVPDKSAVVVAMFRDPYNWVEAMRVEPHHAHDPAMVSTSKGRGEVENNCTTIGMERVRNKAMDRRTWIDR
jgi:hypothetical protein